MQKEILSILEEVAIDRASAVEQLAALGTRLGANMTFEEIDAAVD